jgi:hypothetical protein
VRPGSVIGDNGEVLNNATVGIATVPPELVRDMLPPGLLQHTFDLTIQAPGAAIFNTPLRLTLPNVFNAPAGTKLNLLSFDHTTGRLVIDGSGTVSPDGQFVVTDPDSGITRPGWHGMTPPGGESSSPCDPTKEKTINVDPIVQTSGLVDRFYKDDRGRFTISFRNNAARPDASKDDCEGDNARATTLVVKIEVDGPAAAFLTGLESSQFELAPQQHKDITVNVKDLLGSLDDIETDILYGSNVHITGWKSSDPSTLLLNESMVVYRWLDVSDGSATDLDGSHTDGVLDFFATLADGSGGVQQSRDIELRVGAARPSFSLDSNVHFSTTGLPDRLVFDPASVGTELRTTLSIANPDGMPVGTMLLRGEGTEQLALNLNRSDLIQTLTEIASLAQSQDGHRQAESMPLSEAIPDAFAKLRALLDTPSKRQAFADRLFMKLRENLGELKKGVKISETETEEERKQRFLINFHYQSIKVPGTIAESEITAPAESEDLYNEDLYNYARAVRSMVGGPTLTAKRDFYRFKYITANYSKIVNRSELGGSRIIVDIRKLILRNFETERQFVTLFADQVLRLIGGVLSSQQQTRIQIIRTMQRLASREGFQSLIDWPDELIPFEVGRLGDSAPDISSDRPGVSVAPEPVNSIEIDRISTAPAVTALDSPGLGQPQHFVPEGALDVLKLGLHLDWTEEDAQRALAQIIAYQAGLTGPVLDNAGGLVAAVLQEPPLPGALFALFDQNGQLVLGELDFGAQPTTTGDVGKELRLVSFGEQPVQIEALKLISSGGAFTLRGIPEGTVTLARGESLRFSIHFDPENANPSMARLEILSANAIGPSTLRLTGEGVSPAADLRLSITNNNVGGQDIALGPREITKFASIINAGQQTLLISDLSIIEDGSGFAIKNLSHPISPEHPYQLAAGQTLNIDLAFDPNRIGLVRGQLQVRSNDFDTPHLLFPLVGTGMAPLASSLDFGNDYVYPFRGRDSSRRISELLNP